jgi:hypothetical protein
MNSETRNQFLEMDGKFLNVETWKFLTNHARVLLCIARDPGVRLCDLAASLGITERSAHSIVADLTTAGYVVKHKHGRRNRYQIQAHLPLPEPAKPGTRHRRRLGHARGRRHRAAPMPTGPTPARP